MCRLLTYENRLPLLYIVRFSCIKCTGAMLNFFMQLHIETGCQRCLMYMRVSSMAGRSGVRVCVCVYAAATHLRGVQC